MIDFLTGLLRTTFNGLKLYIPAIVAVALLEFVTSRPLKHYRTRAFLQQSLWFLFQNTAAHRLLIAGWVTLLADHYLGFLKFGLFAGWPVVPRFIAVFCVYDFMQYWLHRLRHSRILWPFHATHHAAEILTIGAATQVHPLDDLALIVAMVCTLMITGTWPQVFASALAIQLFVLFPHTQLNFTWGPLYYVLVSPVFHRFHHSRNPGHANRNFGSMLTVWDYLFGTAVPRQAPPEEYGIEGHPMPTLISQLYTPFRMLHGAWMGGRSGEAQELEADLIPVIVPISEDSLQNSGISSDKAGRAYACELRNTSEEHVLSARGNTGGQTSVKQDDQTDPAKPIRDNGAGLRL